VETQVRDTLVQRLREVCSEVLIDDMSAEVCAFQGQFEGLSVKVEGSVATGLYRTSLDVTDADLSSPLLSLTFYAWTGQTGVPRIHRLRLLAATLRKVPVLNLLASINDAYPGGLLQAMRNESRPAFGEFDDVSDNVGKVVFLLRVLDLPADYPLPVDALEVARRGK
jgi:hypothetical protein